MVAEASFWSAEPIPASHSRHHGLVDHERVFWPHLFLAKLAAGTILPSTSCWFMPALDGAARSLKRHCICIRTIVAASFVMHGEVLDGIATEFAKRLAAIGRRRRPRGAVVLDD
jgi:hypothetical protein